MTNLICRLLISLFFTLNSFIISSSCLAFDIKQKPIPGGIAIIDIGKSKSTPIATYKNKRVLTFNENGIWKAVIGVGLSAKPGIHTVKVTISNSTKNINFTLKPAEYESQYITLKSNKHVNLSKANLDRHKKEKARSRKALDNWDPFDIESLTLKSPTKGVISSPFGLKRFYNNQPRKPHSGLDIAAPKGTPIYAPLAGKITETGNFFFNGHVVFIDHGNSLVSMYCHMDKITASKDSIVKQGDLIGYVGSTGRVTGPHLHWGVSLNGNMVDPLLLTPELRKQVKE